MKTGFPGMNLVFVYARNIFILNVTPRRPYLAGIPPQGIPLLAGRPYDVNCLRPNRTWATPRALVSVPL